MQNTTVDYKIEINKPSRQFECKITIGDNIYTNEDLVNLTLDYPQSQDGFSIGNTISQSLDLTLINNGDTIFSTSQVKVEIGLKVGSTIEYIPMGIFNIDDIEKTDYTTKLTCYDNMIKFETPYFSELVDKPTLQQVVNELSSKTGVKFTGNLPAYTVSKLDGFTCREVLSYVASICAGNAVITRDGNFTIKSMGEVTKTINGDNYFDYTKEETAYKIGKISCQVEDNNILSKGALGTDSMELIFENPWVTETILTEIYNKLNGLTYLGYSIRWQGDLSLEPYDIVSITDTKNVTRKTPILAQKFTYTGGLTSEIEAKGESKNKNSFSSNGSTTNKVNRVVIEQAIIKDALMDKATIKDLEATNAKIQNLVAEDAKINNALINKAEIKDLFVTNANIQNLIAEDAKINNALINKADITQLNAVQGNITSLNSEVANIKTLVNGNLSSENIQAGGITSDKLTIANGFIKNAMIDNLDVSKVNAGDISTNKFRIVSDSGKMLIADNTIQIRDNNRARVQIGKDASSDYNMYIWDKSGKLMFDATGLKADGIKNKIIRDDMISDNANIDGSKINVGSLVTEINKDTNTSVIKSSKVQLDTVGQTLDVAFNSLKTNVDNIEIGGRNLLKDSDFIVQATSSTVAPAKTVAFVNGLDLNVALLGKTVTFSYYVHCPGNRTNGSGSLGNRFGIHGTIQWKNSSTGATKIDYPFADCLTGSYNKQRVAMTVSLKPPSGYDIISSFSFSFQPLAKPNSSETWKMGQPKLEIGNKATDWTPAPEDVNNSIDAVKQVTESNSTTINVMQGQISTAINNTQIIKDGKTTLLKDDYNKTVAKVESINSTIGTHTTKIDQLTGNITSVDTKVNSVQRDLEGTTSTVSSHTTQINGLNSTVSTQGSSISQLKDKIALKVEATDVNNAINNVQIGGRNLLKDSDFIVQATSSTVAPTKTIAFVNGLDLNVALLNKTVTFSYYVHCPGNRTGNRFGIHGTIQWKNSSTGATKIDYPFADCLTGSYNKQRVAMTVSLKPPSGYDIISSFSFSFQPLAKPNSSETWKMGQPKLEIGTKPTDWAPAPEDVDSAITSVDNKVTSTNSKVASIETNLNGITSRVSSTESKVTTINGNITSLQSRMNTAEQKITPTAITSTISSSINNGSSISTTKFVMDKNGLSIKNGGLTIKNNAGTTVFSSDTSGNLKLTGYLETCTFRGKNMVYIEDNGTLSCDGNTYIRHLSVLETHPGWASGTRGSFDCAPTANFAKEVRTKGEFWAANNTNTYLGVIRRGAGGSGYIQIDRMRVVNQKHGSANNYVEVVGYNSNHVFGIDLWSSDEKLKENIVSIEDNNTELLNDDASKTGLDLINNLNHYAYDYKKNFGGDHVTCGYVAQELQELNDSLVMEIEQQDGTTLLQPKASNIIPNLSLAIKQQQEMIEDLKAEIEELKSKIRA